MFALFTKNKPHHSLLELSIQPAEAYRGIAYLLLISGKRLKWILPVILELKLFKPVV